MATSNQSSARPLSPHLQVYRPQVTSVLSIFHRFSGLVLSAASLLLVYWLAALAGGEAAYNSARELLGTWWSIVILFLATLAFYYHLANGIRHLYWDSGRGFELPAVYASGWTVVIATCVLTVLTWVSALVIA